MESPFALDMKKRTGPVILLFSIFAINFLSLVYQVVWVRKIMVIFGTTALSISTILTVFLAGIALGGYLGGIVVRKVRHKYRLAGLALVFLGLYCLASVYMFSLVRFPFIFLSAFSASPLWLMFVKFILCAAILIVPTTIIGAMFPVMTYLYSVEFKRLGRDVATLYCLDTLGAALGAALCGFVLVPFVGLARTSLFAGLAYLILGVILSSIKSAEREVEADSLDERSAAPVPNIGDNTGGFDSTHLMVLAALFVSGFSALVLEVTWSRYFNLIFGTSIYAFAIVLAAFLLGLSIGSFLIYRFLDRIKRPLLVFAYIEILIAGFALVVMQTSSWLEALYFRFFFEFRDFYLFQGVLFSVALLLMIVPTSLMGANFPLAVRIFARSKETRGKDAGFIFSINTAGGIVGAFAAGFLILPLLGMEKTGMLASVIYLLIGVAFLLVSVKRFSFHYAVAIIMTVVFVIFGWKSYGEPELGIAVYYHGIKQSSFKSFQLSKKVDKVIYSKQGFYGLVTVDVDSVYGEMHLRNNGKVDASNGLIDMQTQFMLGYMPLFFHKNPEKVLNIGLGGGFSLGAITSHPDVKAIDTIEIDPLVVEATERYFAKYNHNSLADPRVTVHVEDGRHFIDTTPNTYDVIVSEPPNIWVSGVSQLFTSEFYRIADEHMNEGGILCQWIPSYEFFKEDIEIILSTIRGQFRYVSYWTSGEDFIVLASHEPFVADEEYLERLAKVPQIARDLRGYVRRTSGGGSLGKKLARMLSRPAFSIGADGPQDPEGRTFHTDDLPILEFKTAQNIFLKADQRRRAMRLKGKGR